MEEGGKWEIGERDKVGGGGGVKGSIEEIEKK